MRSRLSHTRASPLMITWWRCGSGENTHLRLVEPISVTRVVSALSQVPCRCPRLRRLNVQDFLDSLEGYSDNSQKRMLASVKSLLAFGHKIGWLPFNVGPAVESPKPEDRLAERILTRMEVHSMIANEPNIRNMTILHFIYASGARESEICELQWRNLQDRENGEGQVSFFGKGRKTRAVPLSRDTWRTVHKYLARQGPDDPVFESEKGGSLTSVQIWRIVRAAGQRVGLPNVSPHWLRHSHATHALEGGCPVHVLQNTLGHASLTTTTKYVHARPDDSSAKYLGI